MELSVGINFCTNTPGKKKGIRVGLNTVDKRRNVLESFNNRSWSRFKEFSQQSLKRMTILFLTVLYLLYYSDYLKFTNYVKIISISQKFSSVVKWARGRRRLESTRRQNGKHDADSNKSQWKMENNMHQDHQEDHREEGKIAGHQNHKHNKVIETGKSPN